MIALRSSVLAAEAGWRVVYWLGENTEHILRERIEGVWGCPEPEWPWCMSNWTPMRFTPHVSLDALVKATREQLEGDEQRLLIVVDSINRLAKHIARTSGNNFFRALESIVGLGQTLAESSAGECGFIGVSELNHRGGAVGLDVEYAAGLILTMKRAPRKRDWADLKIESRESPGGTLGRHFRDTARCQFVDEGSYEMRGQLTLVQGEG